MSRSVRCKATRWCIGVAVLLVIAGHISGTAGPNPDRPAQGEIRPDRRHRVPEGGNHAPRGIPNVRAPPSAAQTTPGSLSPLTTRQPSVRRDRTSWSAPSTSSIVRGRQTRCSPVRSLGLERHQTERALPRNLRGSPFTELGHLLQRGFGNGARSYGAVSLPLRSRNQVRPIGRNDDDCRRNRQDRVAATLTRTRSEQAERPRPLLHNAQVTVRLGGLVCLGVLPA